MTNYDLINKLYKPYRLTKIGKCTLIESSEGKFIIKNKSQADIDYLYQYLRSRNFHYLPKIIDNSKDEFIIYEYYESLDYPYEQRALDLIKIVASLHKCTAYHKNVSEDVFKSIYDLIKNNIDYLKNKYNAYYEKIESKVYMSPSEQLFIKNYSRLINQLAFCESNVNKWYTSVKDKREIRVALIHNNLEVNHFIKSENEYLTSWDKYKMDSPVLDLYNFYQKEVYKIDFSDIFKTYTKIFPLTSDEQELFLVLVCIPKEISFLDNEFKSCELINKSLEYSNKSEILVRPYYLINDEK